jgi:hypothetical protein
MKFMDSEQEFKNALENVRSKSTLTVSISMNGLVKTQKDPLHYQKYDQPTKKQ